MVAYCKGLLSACFMYVFLQFSKDLAFLPISNDKCSFLFVLFVFWSCVCVFLFNVNFVLCFFHQVASGYTVMSKSCECKVIAFPATIDQCHWIAVAGTNSIVRYGLGSGGKYEGERIILCNPIQNWSLTRSKAPLHVV